MKYREIVLRLVGMLRSTIPVRIRKCIQGSPALQNIARKCVSSLLIRVAGKIQIINYGPASGIRLLLNEHITEVYLSGRYETEVQTALVENLKAGDIIYDIGASVGFFSLLGAKLVGCTGKVYAFEPAPHAFKVLIEEAYLNRFDWLIPLQQCKSDKAKK
jgi:hypothetical protein